MGLDLEETNVTGLATIHSYQMHQMPKTSNQTPSGYVKVPAMRFVMSVKFESATHNQ